LLKIRIITALIILPLTLAAVFLAPPWLFRILVAALLLAGCWEFRRIADLAPRVGWVLLVLQALIFAVLLLVWPVPQPFALGLLAAACGAWALMFLRLARFHPDDQPNERFRQLGFLSAVSALSFGFFALCWLRDQANGAFVVFLLFLLIWASDVGAYFSGRLLGRHKLAPRISPKKTWEGVYGGIALAVTAAFLLTAVVPGFSIRAAPLVVIAVVTTLASVGGDLFISIHKRAVALDDTGTFFPGHGGVLDRYDSLLSGAPFYALTYGLLVQ
jgi:phosphatidate cytidylyltransferase